MASVAVAQIRYLVSTHMSMLHLVRVTMMPLQDYFQYEAGGKSDRGLSEESKQGIKKWLEENK